MSFVPGSALLMRGFCRGSGENMGMVRADHTGPKAPKAPTIPPIPPIMISSITPTISGLADLKDAKESKAPKRLRQTSWNNVV